MITEIRLSFGASRGQRPLKFEPGAVTVFVGPNNSGKSLVLRELGAARLLYVRIMPFFIYRLDVSDYVRVRSNVSLAGLNGPLCTMARSLPDEPEWELSESDLIRFYGVDPDQHAFVIDLKPSVSELVSLYRLKHVWGYSANGWTPFALELEGLYVDEYPPTGTTAKSFKERFPALDGPGDRIYEFLYVNGDGKTGSWSFGRVGSVNAPLLWERVFDSFLKRINRTRRDHGLPQLG